MRSQAQQVCFVLPAARARHQASVVNLHVFRWRQPLTPACLLLVPHPPLCRPSSGRVRASAATRPGSRWPLVTPPMSWSSAGGSVVPCVAHPAASGLGHLRDGCFDPSSPPCADYGRKHTCGQRQCLPACVGFLHQLRVPLASCQVSCVLCFCAWVPLAH